MVDFGMTFIQKTPLRAFAYFCDKCASSNMKSKLWKMSSSTHLAFCCNTDADTIMFLASMVSKKDNVAVMGEACVRGGFLGQPKSSCGSQWNCLLPLSSF